MLYSTEKIDITELCDLCAANVTYSKIIHFARKTYQIDIGDGQELHYNKRNCY